MLENNDKDKKNITLIKKNLKKPLLTICIPTYNRGRFVEAQIQTIIPHILNKNDFDVDLVIINNKSTDDTKKRLDKYKHDNLTIIHRTVHYDTAEENMIRSVSYINGEYVWFLGDDDTLSLSSISFVLSMLKSKKYDCFIFNSTTVSPQGATQLLQPMPMNGLIYEGNIGNIVESIGLIYTFAGLSNIIQKTENLSTEGGLNWLQASKIYSHVAWFVESNKNSRVAFVNIPLVYYRQNDYSDGHWDRVAQKQNVQSLYFWSLGIVRLLNRLIERECLTPAQAGGIFELAGDGSRYRLIDDITFKTYSQLLLSIKEKDKREQISATDMAEISAFLMVADPQLFDMVSVLMDAHDNLSRPDLLDLKPTIANKLTDKFLNLYHLRQQAGQFAARFVGMFYGYEAYAMPKQFVAIKSGDNVVREKTLRMIDPISDELNVLTANNIEEICEAAKTASQNLRMLALTQQGHGITTIGNDMVNVNFPLEEIRRMIEDNSTTIRSLVHQLSTVYNSTSWSITAPIRKLAIALRRGKR